MLELCRASESLRQLLPCISLGRLCLERYDAYEHGKADDFLCLYFYDSRYVISTYDNTGKWFFETPEAAVCFVIDNLDDQYPFQSKQV